MELGVGLCISNTPEAVQTYLSAFGLELGYHVLNDDGTYYHSELMQDGRELLCVVEAQRTVVDSPVQLGFTFDTRDALERAFALLREDGKVLMEICTLPWSPCAAEVVDRFGVDWYLTLKQHRPPDDFKPMDY